MLDGKVKGSKYSLGYHITPAEGLLNDPNGLIKFRGEYHVFYQLNPYGVTHANKSWGHVKSIDLVHWERCPIALKPSENYDKDGVYSGSAIEKDGKLYVFYTGNVKYTEEHRASFQCAAVSEDGIHFKKLGPLFEHPVGYTRHVRDPKVWYDIKLNTYWMILGAQREDKTGTVLQYKSDNLLDWQFEGELIQDRDIDLGYMWECPDFLFSNDQDALIISPQGLLAQENKYENYCQTGYFTGKFNGLTGFIGESCQFQEMDRGFEFYAPQTLVDDDRTILFAWMGIMPPDVEACVPTTDEGWLHCLTIPREVTLVNGRIIQVPVKELENMRVIDSKKQIQLENSEGLEVEIEKTFCEMLFDFKGRPKDFSCDIFGSIKIYHDSVGKNIGVSRRNWQNNQIETRLGTYEGELENIRMFVDGSSIEIFVNEGYLVFSSRYFNDKSSRGIVFKGDFTECGIEIYRLEV